MTEGFDCIHIAKATLRDHEGLKLKAYQCTAGKTTIGYGRNLDDRGIDADEAELLLDRDVGEAIRDLAKFSFWNVLSERRRAALIDMRFCLGPHRFRQFKKMLSALEASDYTEAAEQMLDSRFAQQTGRRAENLAKMVREG